MKISLVCDLLCDVIFIVLCNVVGLLYGVIWCVFVAFCPMV